MIRLLIMLCIGWAVALPAYSQTAQADRAQWLSVSFEEINFASPVIAHATLTEELAARFVDALPKAWEEDMREDGFDPHTLLDLVDALPVNETLRKENNDYRLMVTKTERPQTNQTANYLIIRTEKARVPIPLMISSVAVNGIQYLIEDFQGKEKELAALVQAIQSTPPGRLYHATDALDNSWMEIRLE